MKNLPKSFKTCSTNKKAFSLLEVIVSLTIIGFCTIMMMEFMILSFRITAVGLGRSLVREELANVMNLVGRDFRNSDFAPTCLADGSSCEFFVEGIRYKWYRCVSDTRVCKDKFNSSTNSFVNVYTISSNVTINYFKFESGFSQASSTGNSNLILTISASHSNATLGFNYCIKQSSFSLKNNEI